MAVADGEVQARLPLPVARPAVHGTRRRGVPPAARSRAAAQALGCPLACPFGALSFLALPVIPEIKITDQGMFDVLKQEFVRL